MQWQSICQSCIHLRHGIHLVNVKVLVKSQRLGLNEVDYLLRKKDNYLENLRVPISPDR